MARKVQVEQTLPICSRQSSTWIILKTIPCLVLDFLGDFWYIFTITHIQYAQSPPPTPPIVSITTSSTKVNPIAEAASPILHPCGQISGYESQRIYDNGRQGTYIHFSVLLSNLDASQTQLTISCNMHLTGLQNKIISRKKTYS